MLDFVRVISAAGVIASLIFEKDFRRGVVTAAGGGATESTLGDALREVGFGGEGERDGDDDDCDAPYHELRLKRRENELFGVARGLGVTDPGVVPGVDMVRTESTVLAMLGGLADDSMLLLSSSPPRAMRCTEILGLFCSSATRSRVCCAGTLCSPSSGVVQPDESGGVMSSRRSSGGGTRSASEKLPLIVKTAWLL